MRDMLKFYSLNATFSGSPIKQVYTDGSESSKRPQIFLRNQPEAILKSGLKIFEKKSSNCRLFTSTRKVVFAEIPEIKPCHLIIPFCGF